MENEKPLRLRLSPNVRLRMTFEREMALDQENAIFNTELHEKYIRMHQKALEKQDSLIKTALLADGLLLILLLGKNIKIPGTDIGFQDLPAAAEILTFFASFSFMMLCLTFTNSQMYQAICEQFSKKKSLPFGVDPDFIASAEIYSEIYLKTFRKNMNMSGIDFFDAGLGFRWFYASITALLLLSIFSLLFLHISIVGYGLWATFDDNWLAFLFCFSVIIMNVAGLLASIGPSFEFTVTNQSA